MDRLLTEQKALKKLGIEDFRHLTKDKAIMMVSMLDKMEPEITKKAIEQFPHFSDTMYTVNHPYYSNFKPPFPAARF
ncbi:hypothetical protein [Blautia sp. AF19-10LB]|uniref:hypothetical protein n=1 Tax=Blautia sp. AF19-10LB TaxID=2292961 RepID=UPI000E54A4F0|nr:hypothetical protein [Blautia sp. AF19-10LB]RGG56132.1 hypothetical protein DWX28_18575 [Blautia sp. AF19-10LB]